MKIYRVLFMMLLASVVFVAGCNNDDDDDPTTNMGTGNGDPNSIVGVWTLTGLDYTGTSTTSGPGFTPTTTSFVGVGFNINSNLEFKENPNEFVSQGGYSVRLTNTVLSQTFTQEIPDINYVGNGTYVRNGNMLTILSSAGGAGGAQAGEIQKLTADSMILRWVLDTVTVSPMGTTDIDADVTYTMTR
ncbi:MAG: hypothetical protein AAGI38_20185 [Bacteroidota bacterium]